VVNSSGRARPRLYFGVGLVWLVVSLVGARSGRLQRLRPPAPQLVLVGLTAALILLTVRVKGLRAWLRDLDLRWFPGPHITRLVIGLYFLRLSRDGTLPAAFGVPAGWGDAAVGSLALLLVATGPPGTPGRRRWYARWNWLGFLDLLFVVGTAARTALADPPSMNALLRLPLSLLPTFWVPILLASHIVLLRRLERARPAVVPGTA
jgi:hypothetical protein